MSEITDWDDAYANRAYIPDAENYPPRWAKEAEAFRNAHRGAHLELPYGDHPRMQFDLFSPGKEAKGLILFIHGGYWMMFDASSWSHLARGAVERGWAVALPSYVLAPEARLRDIAKQIAAATEAAAAQVSGPIRLAGHSAGGHLATRLICETSPLAADVAARIERVVSISGLHDLHPLMKTKLNDTLQIDAEEARAESPALLPARDGIPVMAWVGGEERPEFVRQSRLLEQNWKNAVAVVEPGRHHFDIIDGLCASNSPLSNALLS